MLPSVMQQRERDHVLASRSWGQSSSDLRQWHKENENKIIREAPLRKISLLRQAEEVISWSCLL